MATEGTATTEMISSTEDMEEVPEVDLDISLVGATESVKI